MMSRFVLAVAIALMSFAAADVAKACGIDSDCMIGDRSYRIRLPLADTDGRPGALVFAHGYKGSAAGTMRNQNLARLADELGVVLVAPKSAGDDWQIQGVPNDMQTDGAQELAYYDALLDTLRDEHGVDPERIVMTGFSAGGMMVWTLACRRSAAFAAFVPIAGTFWAPVPEACDGPAADVIHIHGTTDRIVPLEGRPIAQTHQGSVTRALEMYLAHGGYGPAVSETRGDLSCDARQNADGAILDYCLFEGGHSFSVEYIRSAWDRLTEAGRL